MTGRPDRDYMGALVEADRRLHIRCMNCWREHLIEPADAVARFGAATRISAVRERAKCRFCGARNGGEGHWPLQVGTELPAHLR